ncbi:MAG TPA: hypothetical protein VKU38_10460 [Ktedonobacteraceae bacterium]|nr:hypothetical protein [Ktedonobacteraceae bacterium]
MLASGVQRIVIDTVADGDGANGKRTARSPFAQTDPDWRRTDHAHLLHDYLCEKATGTSISIGWSIGGFCGIPPRFQNTTESA